jgi:hypothetical protein
MDADKSKIRFLDLMHTDTFWQCHSGKLAKTKIGIQAGILTVAALRQAQGRLPQDDTFREPIICGHLNSHNQNKMLASTLHASPLYTRGERSGQVPSQP